MLVRPREQEVAIIQTPCYHRPWRRWETNPTELGACFLGDTRGVLWSGACLGRVEIHIRPFLLLERTRDAPWTSSGSGGRADMRPVHRMPRKAVCVECGSEREKPPQQIQAAVPAEVPQGLIRITSRSRELEGSVADEDALWSHQQLLRP